MEKLSLGLSSGQVGVALLTFIVSINVPRRPDVYNNGVLVDQMRTISLYSLFTFGWANGLLWKALREGRLEEADIPKLDARRRATNLEEAFYKVKSSKDTSLLIHLFKAHTTVFVGQSLLTIAESVITFTPQFFLYK